MEKIFIRSKKYRARKKARKREKLLCKKKKSVRVRKMVSRRKLAKLEIRRSKKITKEQVPLSHNIEDKEVGKFTETLAYTAKLKAKGKVKLFRKNVYSLLDKYSVGDISKAAKIPYYKINRMLTWKRKKSPFNDVHMEAATKCERRSS